MNCGELLVILCVPETGRLWKIVFSSGRYYTMNQIPAKVARLPRKLQALSEAFSVANQW